MKRRELLAVAVGTALSGCASSGDGNRGTTSPPPSPDESSTSADYADSATHNPDAPSLEIRSRATKTYSFTFELTKLDSRETVYAQQKTFEPSDTLGLDPYLSSEEDYRFVVRRFGETLFELTIYPYESYELAVEQGPEIEVEAHIEY